MTSRCLLRKGVQTHAHLGYRSKRQEREERKREGQRRSQREWRKTGVYHTVLIS